VPTEIIGISGLDFAASVQLPSFDLEPTAARNYDFSINHYFGKVGSVGINVFYKKLDGPNYVESRVYEPNHPVSIALNQKYSSNPDVNDTEWTTTRIANAGKGEILGVELSFDRKFDFLPGVFSGLGMNFNTTFINSEVALVLEERFGEKVGLFNQSDRLTNLSVYYEKYGFLARASLLWKGGFLERGGVVAGKEKILNEITGQIGAPANSLDTLVDDFFRLDLRLEYRFKKWGTVFFEGTNLTNEPQTKFYGHEIRQAFAQYTRPIYTIGYKWNL
jgi:TonB-dependent receptor